MAYNDKVTEVIDGDTFKRQSSTKNVRLKNVYAPELGKPGGYAAKRELQRLIDYENVSINETGTTYDRVEAQVNRSRDGLDVNRAMREFLRRT